MEDKKISLVEIFASIKRIELLIEEMIFRQIIQTNSGDLEKSKASFENAMKNVSNSLVEYFQSLPPADKS